MSNEATSLQFSIVIPVYNEAENIEPMVREIRAAFDGRPEAYEVIFVDDASSDDSPAVLQRLTLETGGVVRSLRIARDEQECTFTDHEGRHVGDPGGGLAFRSTVEA